MTWRPDYVTAAQVRAYVRGAPADDATYALYAAASSRAIDRATGRQFGLVAAPEARTYPVRYSRARCAWVADVDDLQTTVGLSGVTGYTLEPQNAVSDGLAWTRMVFSADPASGAGLITPTASWGWSAIPSAIVVAALLQCSRLTARRESPFGIAGSPQVGSELRLLERLDPDVATSIRFYNREVWAA